MFIKMNRGVTKVELDSYMYVSMSEKVLHELQEYVHHFGTEVSGCGLVEKIIHKDKDGKYESTEFRIEEVYLPEKQDNSGASTEIDEKTVHDLMYDLLQKGVDTSKMKLHWHSHVDMEVFHSGTDEDNYTDLNNGDFLVSLVLNKRDDILASIHIYKDMILDIDNVDVYITTVVEDNVLYKKIKQNIEKLDKYMKEQESKKITTYTNDKFNSYSNTHWDSKLKCWVQDTPIVDDETSYFEDFKDYEISMFENCKGTSCHKCQSVYRCSLYFTEMYGCDTKQEYDNMCKN